LRNPIGQLPKKLIAIRKGLRPKGLAVRKPGRFPGKNLHCPLGVTQASVGSRGSMWHGDQIAAKWQRFLAVVRHRHQIFLR